jgi:polyphosphate kinase
MIDPSHPFPFIPNQGLFVVMSLVKKKKNKNKKRFSLILIPKKIERFVNISNKEGIKKYISVEHIISSYANILFPDYKMVKSTSARVIRDSDFEIQEEAEDLVLYLEQALKKRKRGRIVKLEIRSNIDEDLRKFIIKNLEVKKDQIYEIDSFVGSHQIDEIYNKVNSNFIFKPFNPIISVYSKSSVWGKLLVFIVLFLFVIFAFKGLKSGFKEGFEQHEDFLFKTGINFY